MAYDEGLAERVNDYFHGRPGFTTRRMFGGLCYMLNGHMCCGILGDTLMARVGPDQYAACLQLPFAREMDFTGRALTGFVYVAPEGIAEDAELDAWLARCETFVASLPPKSAG
ncbi:TfoX/Sxy family protein [Marinobacterium sediminicola]|uniref:TfoX N-terminal domain-containing protein n=1 Tax=Marinobacterium sediminicola TaxID=518898 RepID=A0ABY1RZY9_9GAMM|nr:TfoX/Sxy family protein [Marinobacterium sediminicola]ULG70060.1 TfoX/Sxy family protein [Marinobacterium sediminicola]SMR74516.1 TfoX N-terminal domain-containing protein [Marinobacterium sediminicola]